VSLLDGIKNIGGSIIKGATAPGRTLLKMAGTSLETGGQVLGNVAKGDLGGAVGAVGDGFKQQVNNVVDLPKEQIANAKQLVGGYGDVLGSGARLIGEPIKGAGQLALNSVATPLNVAGNALQGDFGGAAQAYGDGVGNTFGILGNTARNQWNNLVG